MPNPPRASVTCRHLIDFVADYVDGSLKSRERHELERHLVGCRPCVSYLAAYRTSMTAARALATDDPVDGVPDDLARTIRSHKRKAAR